MSEKQKQEKPWGVLGQLKNHDVILLACVPKRIDDPRYPHLKGFPVNIAYPAAHVMEHQPKGEGDTQPGAQKHHLFWPVPDTYHQDDSTRSLDYHNPEGGPHWVRVAYDEKEGLWWVLQCKGEQVVRIAKGPNFKEVLYHATLGGLNFTEDAERLEKSESDG
jgi:hypothetical protein